LQHRNEIDPMLSGGNQARDKRNTCGGGVPRQDLYHTWSKCGATVRR